jgi:hypothetical protein
MNDSRRASRRESKHSHSHSHSLSPFLPPSPSLSKIKVTVSALVALAALIASASAGVRGRLLAACIAAETTVFQLPIGWLNALAPLNMLFMLVTAAVLQLPIGWLNTLAPPLTGMNMFAMFLTLAVFQLLMSGLHVGQRWKRLDMSVIFETSHALMGPYVASVLVTPALEPHHEFTAVCSSALVANGFTVGAAVHRLPPRAPCRRCARSSGQARGRDHRRQALASCARSSSP